MFGSIKQKLTGSAKRFSGQQDFLEVGSADDAEIEAALKAAKSNPALATP